MAVVFVVDLKGCSQHKHIFISSLDFLLIMSYLQEFEIDSYNSVVLGGSSHLINTSSPSSGLTYRWEFGSSANQSVTKYPLYTFYNYGIIDTTVQVKLVITAGGSGCSDSITKQIIIKPLPRPNFNLSDSVLCYPNMLTVNNISANPKQPRTVFDEDQLTELALSIKEVGLLQPPVVRSIGNGKYQLIMGERRFRAAKLAGLKSIPVIIRQTNDDQLLREALVENIHRSQLNPLEEGAAYQQLLNDFGYTHDELAIKLSKSRPVITNTMRLLNLPPAVQRRVAAGVISAGHARALLSLTDEKEIENLANRIVAEGLTVRAVEEIVASGVASVKTAGIKKGKLIAPKLAQISADLSDRLDTRVRVELGRKKGKIVIEFATVEDLERINKLIK